MKKFFLKKKRILSHENKRRQIGWKRWSKGNRWKKHINKKCSLEIKKWKANSVYDTLSNWGPAKDEGEGVTKPVWYLDDC